MTFGIDIGSGQAGIDLVQAAKEGVEFVFVKMGGLNITPQYVAPHYAEQIDEALRAGLPKGHYWLIGDAEDETTEAEQQAQYMASHLYKFDAAHDVLALDNEPLDANADFWQDAECARFFRTLHDLTGVPYIRMALYGGANKYRQAAPWEECNKLGVRIWWSSYGAQPFTTGQRPTHEPDLQGSVPRWDIHQFTDNSRIAGFNLDGDYTRLSADELFGGRASSVPVKGTPAATGKPKPIEERLHTTAELDGERTDPGVEKSNYWLMVQTIGAREGIYSLKRDGIPGPETRKTEVRLAGRVLNDLRLRNANGQLVQTTAEKDGNPFNGDPSNFSNFVWLVQENGRRRKTYFGKVDGIWGPLTDTEQVRMLAGWMNRNV